VLPSLWDCQTSFIAASGLATDKTAVTLAQLIANRHNTASDHMAAAQIQLGRLLVKLSIPS